MGSESVTSRKCRYMVVRIRREPGGKRSHNHCISSHTKEEVAVVNTNLCSRKEKRPNVVYAVLSHEDGKYPDVIEHTCVSCGLVFEDGRGSFGTTDEALPFCHRCHDRAYMQKVWVGPTPDRCSVCGTTVPDRFVDGLSNTGRWVVMCLDCHGHTGRGFGSGLGRRYRRSNEAFILDFGEP